MILPIAHAYPAEFESTLHASHVIASLVFLDVFRALWTGFRICGNPRNIFRFCTSFLIPFLSGATIAGLMSQLPADETENGVALTRDVVEHATIVASLHAKFALNVWTPFYILVFIRK